MNTYDKPRIGISIGDINGIGPEVVIKALASSKITKYLTPIVYASSRVISFYKKKSNLNYFNYSLIDHPSKAKHKSVNLIECWDDVPEITPGISNEIGGKYAFKSLERTANDLVADEIDAMVTAPINKLNVQNKDFNFPGHTEYLAMKANAEDSLMFMVSDRLRLGVLTGHIPINKVVENITQDKLEKKLLMMIKSVKKDFGISKPKIAVLGLNPHAGEEGLLGSEEIDVIKPVIMKLKNKGNLVMGPFPADGFFGSAQFNNYDAILAMYHDQGLIPFKSLTFSNGVNFTAGLPFIRTSPDHGTAYDMAGKNRANEGSMQAAIFAALDIWKQRNI